MTKGVTPEANISSSKARGPRFWPRSAFGWAVIAFALVALATLVIFPMLTMTYRDVYPVVDTWVMPVIVTTLVDMAAILSLATVWLRRERSILNIVMLIVTMPAGMFFTLIVVGEAIG